MSIRTFLSACYRTKETLRLKISFSLYNRHLKRLLPVIAQHRPVRVLFYVNNLSMWKNDKLIKILKNDKRFDPFVVTYLYVSDSEQVRIKCEEEISRHFEALGINCTSGFDYDRNTRLPVSRFNADIVFYPQPYYNRLRLIPRNVLLAYIPYCFEMDETRYAFNTLYQNICWKMFVQSPLHLELKAKYNLNRGVNAVVAGNPLADYFFDGHQPSADMWKSTDASFKRIIWAPHHSILPDDMLDYSTFLNIADEMLELAGKYSDRVQFVFKPHPMLKEKLYKIESWGKAKTDEYYDAWKNLANGNIAEGNYVDLFMTSDALIHDCSSFTAEYLYVNKPVMFLTDRTTIKTFNSFADACFRVHYHGSTIKEIEAFMDNVIAGVDPMADARTEFVSRNLVPQNNLTVADTIYNELCKLFE